MKQNALRYQQISFQQLDSSIPININIEKPRLNPNNIMTIVKDQAHSYPQKSL